MSPDPGINYRFVPHDRRGGVVATRVTPDGSYLIADPGALALRRGTATASILVRFFPSKRYKNTILTPFLAARL